MSIFVPTDHLKCVLALTCVTEVVAAGLFLFLSLFCCVLQALSVNAQWTGDRSEKRWKHKDGRNSKLISVITACVNRQVSARGDGNGIKYTVKPLSDPCIVRI